MGLTNFYRRFLPGVAVTLLLLTNAIKGSRVESERLTWMTDMEVGFVAAKAVLRGPLGWVIRTLRIDRPYMWKL